VKLLYLPEINEIDVKADNLIVSRKSFTQLIESKPRADHFVPLPKLKVWRVEDSIFKHFSKYNSKVKFKKFFFFKIYFIAFFKSCFIKKLLIMI